MIQGSEFKQLDWESYAGALVSDVAIGQQLSKIIDWGGEDKESYGRVSYIEDFSRKIISLVFRGTDNEVNKYNDICCGRRKVNLLNKSNVKIDSKMELHSGFLTEYLGAQENKKFLKLLKKIAKMLQDDNNLHLLITGGSLGGALATLCLADIKINYSTAKAARIALVTFGSPRTGNKDFAEWLDKTSLKCNVRVEVSHDPVVKMPSPLNGAFHHRGYQTLLTRVDEKNVTRIIRDYYGEKQGEIIQFGNNLIYPVQALDLINTSISGVFASVFGIMIDYMATIAKSVSEGDFIYSNWADGHMYSYRDCNDYKARIIEFKKENESESKNKRKIDEIENIKINDDNKKQKK